MEWDNLYYLLGILALIPLSVMYFKYIKWYCAQQASYSDFLKISKTKGLVVSKSNQYLSIICLVFAWILFCIALANPKKVKHINKTTLSTIDLVLAVDVSKSMDAPFENGTRLDWLKKSIMYWLNHLSGERIASIFFTEQAIQVLPFTNDYHSLSMYIEQAHTSVLKIQGTNFKNLLRQTIEWKTSAVDFNPSTLIIVSDGEDHSKNYNKELMEISSMNIPIVTMGVGNIYPNKIPISHTAFKKDANGNIVYSKYHGEILEELSKNTNGLYIYEKNPYNGVTLLSNFINKLKSKTIQVNQQDYYFFYPWFLLGGFIFLLLWYYFKN